MKTLRLRESCTRYTVTRNRYGDFSLTNQGILNCLYRDISTLNRDVNSADEVAIQGIFWFDPTSSFTKGDVIGYASQFYLVQKVIVAKELVTSNRIHFIKCEVSLYRSIS